MRFRWPKLFDRRRAPTGGAIASAQQEQVCRRFGVAPAVPSAHSKVGIALQTADRLPLNALRHLPEGDTCGWYIWWGEDKTEDPDFFQPLHVEHLPERCPEVMPYLALPPGWWLQVAPGYEDVWYDPRPLGV